MALQSSMQTEFVDLSMPESTQSSLSHLGVSLLDTAVVENSVISKFNEDAYQKSRAALLKEKVEAKLSIDELDVKIKQVFVSFPRHALPSILFVIIQLSDQRSGMHIALSSSGTLRQLDQELQLTVPRCDFFVLLIRFFFAFRFAVTRCVFLFVFYFFFRPSAVSAVSIVARASSGS